MATTFEPQNADRRSFLGFLTVLVSLGIGGVTGIPILYYAIGPALKPTAAGGGEGDKPAEGAGGGDWLEVGSVGDFSDVAPTQKKLTVKTVDGWVQSQSDEAVWVIKEGDKLSVFTATCPHLGCKVDWQPGNNQYYCPCHNSAFEKNGAKKPGAAAARGLDSLESKVEGGKLLVKYQRFKSLAAEKIAI